MDLGSSLCSLAGVGAAHFFHTKNPDPDPDRHRIDDPYTTYTSYPNYHSGQNGNYQTITRIEPVHKLLQNPQSPSSYIDLFPAHPHEGAVGVTETMSHARAIATGKSLVSGIPCCILSTFSGEWKSSASLNSQFRESASSFPIVVLPEPETPITRIIMPKRLESIQSGS